MTGGKVQCQGTKGGIKCKGGWSEGVVRLQGRCSVSAQPQRVRQSTRWRLEAPSATGSLTYRRFIIADIELYVIIS